MVGNPGLATVTIVDNDRKLSRDTINDKGHVGEMFYDSLDFTIIKRKLSWFCY